MGHEIWHREHREAAKVRVFENRQQIHFTEVVESQSHERCGREGRGELAETSVFDHNICVIDEPAYEECVPDHTNDRPQFGPPNGAVFEKESPDPRDCFRAGVSRLQNSRLDLQTNELGPLRLPILFEPVGVNEARGVFPRVFADRAE